MSDDSVFQIVCANCGCLSIKIEEPLQSSRDALVYCGDCGTSRGTVGALRDLAVQRSPDIVFPALSSALSAIEHTVDEPQATTRISTQYAELKRLRQQVKIAEWLAGESHRPHAIKRIRETGAKHFSLRPSPSTKISAYLGDDRDQKRPS